VISVWKQLDRAQRAAFVASLLGWSLDAFDYFLMVFVMRAIARDFRTQVADVAVGLTLTLMFRPLGALLFGWLADRFGRRPVLMADVLLYSAIELASAFAPSLTALLILRALFGIAMGGEWGVGASLVMETVPAPTRGILSGILQEGYPLGALLASAVYGLFFSAIGWRGMFVIGVAPAALVLFIRLGVKESPAWERLRARQAATGGLGIRPFWRALRQHAGLLAYVVVLMAAFNFFSHGTQDLYPTFLQAQRHLSPHRVSFINSIASVGAIVGGVTFGAWSQRIGRKRAIIIASLIALPVFPLWLGSTGFAAMLLGAFFMQFAVQGAWGTIPAHLNELSPPEIRGTFPGFAYQLGNLLASINAVLQARIAAAHHGNYALALASVAGVTVFVVIGVTAFGPERREAVLA
jgi:SHS family lactate transporter-like MFS transporter